MFVGHTAGASFAPGVAAQVQTMRAAGRTGRPPTSGRALIGAACAG
jgi:hypothetical protein